MTTFKDLKKNRLAAAEKLSEKLASANKVSYADDERMWRPTKDASGNAFGIVRFFFLPDEESNEVPYVLRYEHSFKGPSGQWYIENSRTTLAKGEPDPVTEYTSPLWQSKIPENVEKARQCKRKKYYFANILVIKDPNKPENEGKVFIYKFGQKVMDKIIELQKPEYEGDEPIDPFDLWEGVNFRINIAEVAGYPNYDKCKFESRKTPIAEDEETIEKIWKSRHDLNKLIAPEAFKSYDELKSRFDRVMGAAPPASRFNFDDEDEKEKDNSAFEKSASSNSKFSFDDEDEKEVVKKPVSKAAATVDEDDDDLAFFNSLKN